MNKEPRGLLIVSGLSPAQMDVLIDELEECSSPHEYLAVLERVEREAIQKGINCNIHYRPLEAEE